MPDLEQARLHRRFEPGALRATAGQLFGKRNGFLCPTAVPLEAKSYEVKRYAPAQGRVKYRMIAVLLTLLELGYMPWSTFASWIRSRVGRRDHAIDVGIPQTREPIETDVGFSIPCSAGPRRDVKLPRDFRPRYAIRS